jgi:threonine/homoserine/homoserine lactone efflux protein
MDYTYLSKLLITVLFGMILGLVSSIPVGAVQLQVIKKSINGHFRSAIATALGSATSDLIYGILTLFGLGGFLLQMQFQVAIYSLGIVVLAILVYRTIRERRYILNNGERPKQKGRYSYLSGITIAITNPGMIIWWLIGYKLYLDLNLFPYVEMGIKTLFIISGCFGLGGYLIFIASLLHRVKESFQERFIYKANIFLSILLVMLIVYFTFKLIAIIFNINVGI